ncbi:VOC family protein [Candidatus Bipolaricaulota bacterium]
MTESGNNFTGVVLPVFFVQDTLVSLPFYRDTCGFELVAFYDEDTKKEIKSWDKEKAPLFVRFKAGTLEFALHLNRNDFSAIGGLKHYFEVLDVDQQHRRIIEQGGEPTEIADLPWMRLFAISDPDGHRLFFQTSNAEWRKG